MTPMCNGLAVLSPEHLSFCISMLGQFGQQVIMNIGLTVAKNGDTYRQSGVGIQRALWMCFMILLVILCLRVEAQPDMRIGAIQTSAVRSSASPIPLHDKLSPHAHANPLTLPSSPGAATLAADADRPALLPR